MRIRIPNQLHASLYVEEDVKRRSNTKSRKNIKNAKENNNSGRKIKASNR
jgi:hypothetical protein